MVESMCAVLDFIDAVEGEDGDEKCMRLVL